MENSNKDDLKILIQPTRAKGELIETCPSLNKLMEFTFG